MLGVAGLPQDRARAAPATTDAVQPGDMHEHHEHESDDALHDNQARVVVVESPTDGPQRPETGASDLVIEPGKLAEVPRRKAEDLLTLSPGVVLANVGGEGHPSGVYVRGFDAGEGENLEFSVEGVPINEIGNPDAHGFADTGFVIPELVSSLRFTQGAFDPAQGDFAIAGSAGYSLGMRARGVVARGEYGSFNRWRSLVLFGPHDQEAGTFVGADVQGGDGFGRNRAHRSNRVMGGYAHTFPRHTHLRVFGAAHVSSFGQAGLIRSDDVEQRSLPCARNVDAQFYCSPDSRQGGDVSRYVVGARVFRDEGAIHFSQSVFASGRLLEIRENFTGFTADLAHPQGPRGDGLGLGSRMLTVGARGAYGMRVPWRDELQRFDVGYQMRFDSGQSSVHRLSFEDGRPYLRVFDHRINAVNPGMYLRATFVPARWFQVTGGARLDAWVHHVDRREEPEAASPTAVGLALQPRVAGRLIPLEWLHVVGAYGVGTRSADPNGAARREVPTARARGGEVGVQILLPSVARRISLDARIVGFHTHVTRDLAFDEDLGRNVAEGASNHSGVLGSLRLGVNGWLDVLGSVTWAEARFEAPDAGALAWGRGEQVAGVPDIAIRGDATLWHGFTVGSEHFTWNVAAGLAHVGRRPLSGGPTGSGFTVLDLGASMRWRWVELGIEVENATNLRYHEVEQFYASRFDPSAPLDEQPVVHFAAGAPLTALGTLALYFEPGEVAHFRKDRDDVRRRRGVTRRR